MKSTFDEVGSLLKIYFYRRAPDVSDYFSYYLKKDKQGLPGS